MFGRKLKTIRVKPVHVPQILKAHDEKTTAKEADKIAHYLL